MKPLIRALLFAAVVLGFPAAVLAQQAPATMPYHTVYGRLGAAPGDTGPGQAIPFNTLFGQFNSINAFYVTPQMFGAKCDGATDDTAALQAAMATSLPMYVPPGSNCLFSAELDYAGTGTKEVFSAGRSAATLTMTNATQNGLVRTNGNFHIHDISITTNILKTIGAAIYMEGPSNNVDGDLIMNCNIFGTASFPLYIGIDDETDVIPAIIDNYILSTSVAGLKLNNVTASGGGEALVLGNTFNTVLTPGNSAAAILYQSGLLSLRITSNIIESYDYGISINVPNGGDISAAIITGNTFEANLVGVVAGPTGSASMDSIIINGNYFNPRAAGFSILTQGASNWIDRTNIIGNSFSFQAGGSIHLAAGVTANVVGNTFSAGGNVSAILLEAAYPSGKAFINGNTFDGTNAPIALNSNAVAVATNNPGYNPVGQTVITPGASPWTYTAGASPVELDVAATTAITGLTRGSVAAIVSIVGANVNFPIQIDPRSSVVITYTGTLFATQMVH
jgi:hypothetical protein